jgi:hypothetical protein
MAIAGSNLKKSFDELNLEHTDKPSKKLSSSIAGSKLGISTANELNVQESNKPFLEKQFEKYQVQPKAKNFNQNADVDDNGGLQVKAIMEGLLISKFIPRKATIKKEVGQVQFNGELKNIIKKEENNKERIPSILF